MEEKKSICQILSVDNDILGTGFYIGNQRVVTAEHVINEVSNIQVAFLEIDDSMHPYKVINVKKCSHDIVVLFILADDALNSCDLTVFCAKAMIGSRFCSYGYPGEVEGQIAYVEGTIINAQDGVEVTDYNLDLNVEKGVLTNYRGMSGSPIIINGQAIGILTAQNNNILRGIEFDRSDFFSAGVKKSVCNEEDYTGKEVIPDSDLSFFIEDYLHNNDNANGYIFVEGNNGSGKTTWCSNINFYNQIYVIGKYYINPRNKKYPVEYYKSTSVFYDWLCKVSQRFCDERIDISFVNQYVEQLKSGTQILKKLDDSLKKENKKGVLIIDGIDELERDNAEQFVAFFSSGSWDNLSIIITTSNITALPNSLKRQRRDNNTFLINRLDDWKVKAYLDRYLNKLDSEYIDKLTVKINGNPLYMHYVIETINSSPDESDYCKMVDELPLYKDSIQVYYEHLWRKIEQISKGTETAACVARLRDRILKNDFLKIFESNQKIYVEKALAAMKGVLCQTETIELFHDSFRKYVCDMTEYIDADIHHVIGKYCYEYIETEYGVQNIIYHLLNGNEEDIQNGINECDQKWMDRATISMINPEIILYDMRTALGCCCDKGLGKDLIRILLLMERTEYRYNTIFAKYAFELCTANIAGGYTDGIINYMIRQGIWLMDADEIWICFEMLLRNEMVKEAEVICDELEDVVRRAIKKGEALDISLINSVLRMYAGLMSFYYDFYLKKSSVLMEIVMASNADSKMKNIVLSTQASYFLWEQGKFPDDEIMAERGISVNQNIYDMWIRTYSGMYLLEKESLIKRKGNDNVIIMIIKYSKQYNWSLEYETIFHACFTEECKDTEAVIGIMDCNSLNISLEETYLSDNGCEVDNNKFQRIIWYYRNEAYRKPCTEYVTVEDDINNDLVGYYYGLIKGVAYYYGSALRLFYDGSNSKLHDVTKNFKVFLTKCIPSFSKRAELKDAYYIPEFVVEGLMVYVAKYFLMTDSAELTWLYDFMAERLNDQMGIYHEACYRSYMRILDELLLVEEDYSKFQNILELLYKDICKKVSNKSIRTEYLLKLCRYFEIIGCNETANDVYKEMLSSSMGPSWYKEDQVALLEHVIEALKPKEYADDRIARVMTCLDKSSGGVTFERYIRDSKEHVIALLWEKGYYSQALYYLNQQILPGVSDINRQLEREPSDKTNEGIGNFRLSKRVDIEDIITRICTCNIPDDIRWALSEIYLMQNSRYYHDFIRIQCELLSKAGKNKKKYIERVLHILLCDADGEQGYSYQQLIELYRTYLSDDDFEIISEIITENGMTIPEIPNNDMIHNKKDNMRDDYDELYIAGLFGHMTTVKETQDIFEDMIIQENKKNYSKVRMMAIDILTNMEAGGWSIWTSNTDSIVKNTFLKLVDNCESQQQLLGDLKYLIVNPRYSRRYLIADKVINLLSNISSDENADLCKELFEHFDILLPGEDAYNTLISNKKYESEIYAAFELLFFGLNYPDGLVEQKTMEMFSWLMSEHKEYIGCVFDMCFSTDLSIAETASAYCLHLSEKRDKELLNIVEKYNTDRFTSVRYWMVKANLYKIIMNYHIISEILDDKKLLLQRELFSNKVELEELIDNNIREYDDFMEYIIDKQSLNIIKTFAVKYDDITKILLDNCFDSIEDVKTYHKQLASGFHNDIKYSLRMNLVYKTLNLLDYEVATFEEFELLYSLLERVNSQFPLTDVFGNEEEKVVNVIDEAFESGDYSKLSDIYNKYYILGYQAIILGEGLTTLEMMTYVVDSDTTLEDFIYEENPDEIINAPIKKYRLGYALSRLPDKMDNIYALGINKKDIISNMYVGNRRWKHYEDGMPQLQISYAKVEANKIHINNKKIVAQIIYDKNGIRSIIYADIKEHNVLRM